MELTICCNLYYRVKKGQTLREIAFAFGIPPRVLAVENSLSREVWEGQVLKIPQTRRNLYCVRGGESKTLLCGSKEQFEEINRTSCIYPAQKVFI